MCADVLANVGGYSCIRKGKPSGLLACRLQQNHLLHELGRTLAQKALPFMSGSECVRVSCMRALLTPGILLTTAEAGHAGAKGIPPRRPHRKRYDFLRYPNTGMLSDMKPADRGEISMKLRPGITAVCYQSHCSGNCFFLVITICAVLLHAVTRQASPQSGFTTHGAADMAVRVARVAGSR